MEFKPTTLSMVFSLHYSYIFAVIEKIKLKKESIITIKVTAEKIVSVRAWDKVIEAEKSMLSHMNALIPRVFM